MLGRGATKWKWGGGGRGDKSSITPTKREGGKCVSHAAGAQQVLRRFWCGPIKLPPLLRGHEKAYHFCKQWYNPYVSSGGWGVGAKYFGPGIFPFCNRIQ